MEHYLGVKLVQARSMTRAEFADLTGLTVVDGDETRAGYLVQYKDGYQSWSPKEAFEEAYLPLDADESRITQDVIDAMVSETSGRQIDPKTTLVTTVCKTGFVLHEASSCVDPANYDTETGIAMGVKTIKNKLWFALGFVLQWARFGLKQAEQPDRPADKAAAGIGGAKQVED